MKTIIDIAKALAVIVLVIFAIKYRKTIKNTVTANTTKFTTWIKEAK